MGMFGYANPLKFVKLADRLIPFLWVVTAILLAWGLWLIFFVTPDDYQQGTTVKIMFIHVPAAWMAMFTYGAMTVSSVIGFIWRHQLADLAAKAAAPIGAGFTVICLVTGSLWGAPMWGTWWVWDARLTSVLVLFFIYIGYIALWEAIDDPAKAARACAILCIVGAINLPIIKFSVDWWNTLHQPASVVRMGGPAMDKAFLTPLFVMAGAFHTYLVALLLMRIKSEIHARRIRAHMMAQVARADGPAKAPASAGANG